jgi:hypothetical protein
LTKPWKTSLNKNTQQKGEKKEQKERGPKKSYPEEQTPNLSGKNFQLFV